MPQFDYEKDKVLAELFTYLLIQYEWYKSGSITKIEYEMSKSAFLYDKRIYAETLQCLRNSPEGYLFSDPNKMAVDVLNDLIGAGAINSYEYNTLKERHLLYK